MSLIDTLCIGKCCSMVQLAAMGPSTLVFSAVTTLFSAVAATSIANTSRILSTGAHSPSALYCHFIYHSTYTYDVYMRDNVGDMHTLVCAPIHPAICLSLLLFSCTCSSPPRS